MIGKPFDPVSYPEYVLGFAFDEGLNNVVLIRKAKPPFMRGRINGIGGKIDTEQEHRHPSLAMSREFNEETGVQFLADEWKRFAEITCSEGQLIQVFTTRSQVIFDCGTNEDKGEIVSLYDPRQLPSAVMNNVRWLVPMALDQYRQKSFTEIHFE